MPRRYWGYRIDVDNIAFFRSELENGRLRQGWGWDELQNLRDLKVDWGAKRNLSIFNNVKKGDILLVPRLPTWDEVAVLEATEDFSTGYEFSIDKNLKDYGHVFPVKKIKQFVRSNENIPGKIRATIKNVSRFWNIDHCRDEIEELIKSDDKNLRNKMSFSNRFSNTITDSFNQIFDEKKFSNQIYQKLNEGFSNEEWEYALVEGLKSIFPEPILVERTGGISEAEHGTDIAIKIPGLLNYQYVIAIQVKDYEGYVNDSPLKQLSKADKYWNNDNMKLIDKILIITKSKKVDNDHLTENEYGIKIIFANELEELLSKMGRALIGINID